MKTPVITSLTSIIDFQLLRIEAVVELDENEHHAGEDDAMMQASTTGIRKKRSTRSFELPYQGRFHRLAPFFFRLR